jgi:hypothetical protein
MLVQLDARRRVPRDRELPAKIDRGRQLLGASPDFRRAQVAQERRCGENSQNADERHDNDELDEPEPSRIPPPNRPAHYVSNIHRVL